MIFIFTIIIASMSIRQLSLSGSRRSNKLDIHDSHITELVDTFGRISSSIHLQIPKSDTLMFGLQKQRNDFKEDPHTKLRNIQNKSELNRAEVELMILRKPKRYGNKTQRYTKDDERNTYKSIYDSFKQSKPPREVHDTQFTEEDYHQYNSYSNIPSNIKHMNHLKHHPRLLEYTIQKLRQKNQQKKEVIEKRQNALQLKKALQPAALALNQQFQEMLENSRKNHVDEFESPKALVQNQLTKFYSKSSKGRLDAKIRENPRCNKILQKQTRIVMSADERNLSKQNMKKLKQRLNEIVNEINKNDRRNKQALPVLPRIVKDTHLNHNE